MGDYHTVCTDLLDLYLEESYHTLKVRRPSNMRGRIEQKFEACRQPLHDDNSRSAA
jgi:hypothetical protein